MNGENQFELSAERRAVIDCVDAYESADVAERTDLRSFVSGIDAELQPAAIEELVKVDMEYRWKSGRPKTTGEYVEEYPEIARDADSSLALLKYESHVRTHTRAADADSTWASTPTEGDLEGRESDVGQTSDLPAAGPHDDTLAEADVSPETKTPTTRPTHIGRFRIEDELGRGTFGVVYRCHDEQLHRDVAIKIPHPARRMSSGRIKAFLHEAQVSARMKHPGIVTILDNGTTEDGRGYIVYELIRGVTLKDRITAGNVDRRQAVLWIAQVADALHHAHKNGLVHRDIKPANILVDDENKTHLTDFGLAKIDDQFFTDDSGRVLGTVAYMNPEQASGQAHWASPQSDIYSLGVVLYELLCGKRPFTAGSSLDLIKQVEQRPPSPPRTVDDSIPRPLEEICLKAMAKDPHDRYRTASDMAAALRAAVAPKSAPSPLVRAVKFTVAVAALVVAGFFVRDYLVTPDSTKESKPTPTVNAFEVDLQSSEQVAANEGDFDVLGDDSLPLSAGDRLQLQFNFSGEAYPYVFWYDADGNAELKWPPAKELDKQQKENKLLLPELADSKVAPKWYRLSGTRSGPQLIVVGLSEEQLSEAELTKFAERKLALPPRLARRRLVREAFPQVFDGGAGTVIPRNPPAPVRGGDNTEVVTSVKNEVPPEFLDRLEERFVSYRLLVFRVEAGEDSSSRE